MTTASVQRIVVGYDYSPISDLALAKAFELAATKEDSEIHVVHVVMLGDHAGAGVAGVPVHPTTSLDASLDTLQERVKANLAEWSASTGDSLGRVHSHIRVDAPAGEIAQLASDLEAQMIIVGTHGRRGLKRFLLGSVAEGVVRMAHCAVLVVRPEEEKAEIPSIEPPCPKCLQERKKSGGKEFWCEQHRERHGQRHTYHYQDRVSSDGSMPLVTGMRR
jgi:nucleotide-binding universal stress UspA family protein